MGSLIAAKGLAASTLEIQVHGLWHVHVQVNMDPVLMMGFLFIVVLGDCTMSLLVAKVLAG
jgi:hypothetical protein